MARTLGQQLAEGTPAGPDRPAVPGTPPPASLSSVGDWWLAAAGGALGLTSIGIYATKGYSHTMGLLWLAALVLLGLHFLSISTPFARVARIDLVIPLGLMAVFAPIYVLGLYNWPVQVGPDEEVMSSVVQTYATQHHVDLFGTSAYFGCPAALFVAWGKIVQLFGNFNDLGTMRLLPAIAGVLAVGLSYLLFRQLLSRPWAVFAAVVFGVNHSFLMLSRMIMQQDFTPLVEVVALTLLLLALRKNHFFAMFCAGVAMGLGFYVHFSAREIVVMAAVFIAALAIWFRTELGGARLLRLSATAAVGCALVATPYLIAYSKAPPSLTAWQRESLLLLPEGLKKQQNWVFASSELAGYAKNVEYGLTAFNRPIVDHGWFYSNPGHGIVDPLTGALLWLGVGSVLFVRVRRRREPWPLLLLAGFLTLWLLYSFVVNTAPDYPRMLGAIPLVAYLATEGVRAAASLGGRLVRRRFSAPQVAVVAGCALVAIVAWNGLIAREFLRAGRDAGDPIGSTGRFVVAHRNIPGVRFYLAASDRHPYYVWGQGMFRLSIFVANPQQLGGVVEPRRLGSFRAAAPFAVFMSRDLWAKDRRALHRRYPQGRLRKITPDGRLVVLQVPRARTA